MGGDNIDREDIINLSMRLVPATTQEIAEKLGAFPQDVENALKNSFLFLMPQTRDGIWELSTMGASLLNNGGIGDPRTIAEMTPKQPEVDPKKYFEDRAFVPKIMGDELMANTHFKTLIGTDKIYHYDNGVYIEKGTELIKEKVIRALHNSFKKHHITQTLAYIEGLTYIDPDLVNTEWINFDNGLYNPMTGEFRDHTPEIFSVVRIPIKYDPGAKCPEFIKFLEEKVKPEDIPIIQEMFGYCYMPGQKFQRGFMIYGPKRTGKSTLLYVLSEMLGLKNITALSLQQLTNDQFAMAYLYGKSANICADISSAGLRNTEKFMVVTGGDVVTIAKKHGHYFSFYPSAKFIFSCNAIPGTTNKDLAFYRRWILLCLDIQTPKDEVDASLKEKLRDEFPGIMNWAFEGLKRLQEQGKFSYTKTDEEIKDLYERNSDSIQSFIFNEIDTQDDLAIIKKRIAYEKYVQFCQANRLPVENVIKFGRMFKAHTGCGTGQTNKIPCYQGVRFKNEVKGRLDEYT